MEETTKKPSGHLQPASNWVRQDDSFETYSNMYFIDWSITDVRIRFGQMIPTDRVEEGKVGFVIEERAAITIAWPQLKALRDALIDSIDRFEKMNGSIDLQNLKLPK